MKVQEQLNVIDRLSRFSSWCRLKAAVARCLKFKDWLREKARKIARGTVPQITVQALENTEIEGMKLVQAEAFSVEIKVLQKIKVTEGTPKEQRQLDKMKRVSLKRTPFTRSFPGYGRYDQSWRTDKES